MLLRTFYLNVCLSAKVAGELMELLFLFSLFFTSYRSTSLCLLWFGLVFWLVAHCGYKCYLCHALQSFLTLNVISPSHSQATYTTRPALYNWERNREMSWRERSGSYCFMPSTNLASKKCWWLSMKGNSGIFLEGYFQRFYVKLW